MVGRYVIIVILFFKVSTPHSHSDKLVSSVPTTKGRDIIFSYIESLSTNEIFFTQKFSYLVNFVVNNIVALLSRNLPYLDAIGIFTCRTENV